MRGLLERRVHDELARFHVAPDAHAGSRAVERRAAREQRRGGAGHADGVGRVHAVHHERGGDDVHFLLEPVRETRADGTVDHARRERALVGRTRLALQVAAGNAPDRVHLLDEVHREREEVVVALLLRHDGRDEHGRFSLRDEHGARRLLGQLARLQAVLLAVQFEGFDDLFHSASFFLFALAALVRTSFFGGAVLTVPMPSRAGTPLHARPPMREGGLRPRLAWSCRSVPKAGAAPRGAFRPFLTRGPHHAGLCLVA